ncbi:hypothetical protein GCM10009827_016070 [Dactylosporangium maewongense]|uniref:Uncharacterized protein n=1 Tax=Dactylosporangium maewongense TaxID=634393 RepID=A0ABN1ZT09_9ACTN
MREKLPPVSQLDAQDRQDTRATSDDETLRRYKSWQWHKVSIQLVHIAGGATIYLVAVVVGLLLIPGATPQVAMGVAGVALAAGSGAMAVSRFTGRSDRSGRSGPPTA